MNKKLSYKVLEDVTGGLHLYVWSGDNLIYGAAGFEANPGSLLRAIAEFRLGGVRAIKPDGSVKESFDPEIDILRLTDGDGWEIVAESDVMYPMDMRSAAIDAFTRNERTGS